MLPSEYSVVAAPCRSQMMFSEFDDLGGGQNCLCVTRPMIPRHPERVHGTARPRKVSVVASGTSGSRRRCALIELYMD